MDSSSQTDANYSTSSVASTQTVTKVDKAVTAEYSNDENISSTTLSSSVLNGLSEASARMLMELESNDRSFALRGYFGFESNDESLSGASSILASVAMAFEQPEESENRLRGGQGSSQTGFPCSAVSWNSTGLLLAVAYGMSRHQHGGWCNHRSGVSILSSTSSSLTNKLNKSESIDKWAPEMILDTESCVTALAFHPREPSIIAAGTFSGELVVWDVQRGLRAEDNESGEDAAIPSNDSNLDPLLFKTRIDDYLHREAVCGLAWVKDPSLTDEYLLVSVSCEGKMLLWSQKNKLIHPISCSQVAVEPSALKRDKGGVRGGKVDDGSDEEEDRLRRGASKRVDSSSSLRGIGVSTMCALPETNGFPCIVGGESGFLMKCELSVSSAALAASAYKEGSPWRPEHKVGSLNRAENSLPWEQAAAEILMRAPETDRARICRGVEKWTREVGAKMVTLPLFLASRPDAPLGVIFTNPVKSQLSPHVGPINSVALHPSRRNVLLSAGADGRLCVYSTLQSKPLLELDASVAAISAEGGDAISKGVIGLTACSWSAVNPLVFAVGSSDGGVSVFDLFDSTSLPALVLRGESSVGLDSQNVKNVDLYHSSTISRSMNKTRSTKGEARVGTFTSVSSSISGSITSVSFNPRMHEKKRLLLAVCDSAGTVRLWQLPWRLAGDEMQAKAALETWLGTD